MGGASGLEGLGGTPQRVASPTVGAPAPLSSMDDMMGLFDTNGLSSAAGGMGGMQNDVMNGFAGLDLSGASPPPQQQLGGGAKKTNEDLLGMF